MTRGLMTAAVVADLVRQYLSYGAMYDQCLAAAVERAPGKARGDRNR